MSELSQSPERYARLKEVYLAVRELELERREERLEQLCAGDRELREAARELLTEDSRTGHEFERLLANVVPRKAPEAESLPPRIGSTERPWLGALLGLLLAPLAVLLLLLLLLHLTLRTLSLGGINFTAIITNHRQHRHRPPRRSTTLLLLSSDDSGSRLFCSSGEL